MNQNYKNSMSSRQKSLVAKLQKLQNRIQKRLDNDTFAILNSKKRFQLLKRLRRNALQLERFGFSFRNVVAGSALALALSLGNVATAQTFTEQTGASNPLNAIVDYYASPTFVDIDNDGDFDLFIGEKYSDIIYFENTGTNVTPTFVRQNPGNNPLFGVSTGIGMYAKPTFVDIDGDGDFDFFSGEEYGTIKYFENTGTNVAPTFVAQTGANNPLDGVNLGSQSAPTNFVDIDGDGDFDVFIGEKSNTATVAYFENTGTNVAPTFVAQTGANNPLDLVSVGGSSTPTLVDVDGDGDFDAFVGSDNGKFAFYENTGTNIAPAFTHKFGANNPLDGEDVGVYSAPAFIDIDNDGDFDMFSGSYYSISFYENTSAVLPVELTTFTAETQENQTNLLQWETASEEDNEAFEVERSVDGKSWEQIGVVEGNGTTITVSNYDFIDENPVIGMNYYRLKQMDFDGQFEYSQIVNAELIVDNKELAIYPNPVEDKLMITNAENIENITIFNILGQPIKQLSIVNYPLSIDTNDLPKGQYILSVQNIDGSIVTKHFMK